MVSRAPSSQKVVSIAQAAGVDDVEARKSGTREFPVAEPPAENAENVRKKRAQEALSALTTSTSDPRDSDSRRAPEDAGGFNLQAARQRSVRRLDLIASHEELQRAPAEVLSPLSGPQRAAYEEFLKLTDLREPFALPARYLAGTKRFVPPPDFSQNPTIAFINGRAGGATGPRLVAALSRAIGRAQVFDVRDDRPASVLTQLWANLEIAAANGEMWAAHALNNLTIVVGGGDGSVTWILQVIKDLQLEPPPRVAVIPLGTGNDISRCLGWGKSLNDRRVLRNFESLYAFLHKLVVNSQPVPVDCWEAQFSMPGLARAAAASFLDPHTAPYRMAIAESEESESDDAAEGTDRDREPILTMKGPFWAYLSIGLDAYAAWGFHTLREKTPRLASNRILNQAWYGWFSLRSGWLTGAPGLTRTMLKRVMVRRRQGGTLEELKIPSDVRALILLNIPSYGGGRNPFGFKKKSKRFQPQSFSDGLIEVVGLKGGLHSAMVMAKAPKLHGRRLAQVAEVIIELQAPPPNGRFGLLSLASLNPKPRRAATAATAPEDPDPAVVEPSTSSSTSTWAYLQLDGEAWRQRVLPEAPLVVRVTCGGQSRLSASVAVAAADSEPSSPGPSQVGGQA